MNSLTMFEGDVNPLLSYLKSVSKNYDVCTGIHININSAINITLPNKKCIISISNDIVTVNRIGNLDAYIKEREAHYQISSIEVAKSMVGLLSGICYEFGCKSYKDADTTVKLIFHYLSLNLYCSTEMLCI